MPQGHGVRILQTYPHIFDFVTKLQTTKNSCSCWLRVVCIGALALTYARGEDFALIGDFGVEARNSGVVDLIESWKPQFIVTLGDNSYEKSNETYAKQIAPMFQSYIDKGNFYPCLGNHELHYAGSGIQPGRWQASVAALKPPQGPGQPGAGRWYDFTRGPVHFFVINSNTEGPDSRKFTEEQGDWLREGLRASRIKNEPFRVVVFHHPPYSLGVKGVDLGMQWPFKEWGASVVISGHDHNYQVLERRGLKYIVNGLGGDGDYPVNIDGTIAGVKLEDAFPPKKKQGYHGALKGHAIAESLELTMEVRKRKPGGQWDVKTFPSIVIKSQTALPAPAYRDLALGAAGIDVAAWQDFLLRKNPAGRQA
jgi:predicted phosphodiesterase